YGCYNNSNAELVFDLIIDKILIVKNGIGDAYLPEWGFNGIGDLQRGYGYQIKVTDPIYNYNICDY
ncbi:MAG: hypothetical protein NZ735_02815, partial [Candidatus Marinimicrobia bacterium]|nr:hypothetical protein [Candidatus Neomarinimicrobiota bacterium]